MPPSPSRMKPRGRKKRRTGLSSLLGLCLLLAAAITLKGCAPPDPPNILFFYVDDLGWKDVGFNGSTYYETPAIDALAAQGMVLTNAYANAPNCAPSRASLLSGLYPSRHKIYTVAPAARGREEDRLLIPPPDTRELGKEFTTLSEVLQQSGYATAHFGKWHLGGKGNLPTDRGFDLNVGGFQVGAPPGGYFPPYRNPHLEDGPPEEHLTNRLTDEALRFLEAPRESPFFLYLAHYAVHTPIQAPAELEAAFAGKAADGGQYRPDYAAMIASVDASLARLLAYLDDHDLTGNTLVIFYSDNGGFAGATSNEPLRGFKGMLYEGGIRVPLAMRWPGRITAGQTSDTPVIGTDFFPTLAGLAKAPMPALLDGIDLRPLMSGQAMPQRPIFWHFPAYLQAGPGVDGLWRTTPAGAIRLGDYKLIEFFEDGRLELYNLKEDPSESRNLAEQEPETARRLHALLQTWRTETGADMPTPKGT